jgi:hypothetical protein
VAPEYKFMLAASRFLPSVTLRLAAHTPVELLWKAGTRLFATMCSLAGGYEVLPFGYGRDRPINFRDEVFYFQQGTAEEIAQYRGLTGF